jgi:hypothetical protein
MEFKDTNEILIPLHSSISPVVRSSTWDVVDVLTNLEWYKLDYVSLPQDFTPGFLASLEQ